MLYYVLDFITLVVHGHGRGTHLGTCLVQQQCVFAQLIYHIALVFRTSQHFKKKGTQGFLKTDARIFAPNLPNFGFSAVRMMDIRIRHWKKTTDGSSGIKKYRWAQTAKRNSVAISIMGRLSTRPPLRRPHNSFVSRCNNAILLPRSHWICLHWMWGDVQPPTLVFVLTFVRAYKIRLMQA